MTTPSILAFAFGGPEMIIVLAIVILLFGAKKLPELARGLGKAKSEFQKASDEAEKEFKAAADEPKQPAAKPSETVPPPSNN